MNEPNESQVCKWLNIADLMLRLDITPTEAARKKLIRRIERRERALGVQVVRRTPAGHIMLSEDDLLVLGLVRQSSETIRELRRLLAAQDERDEEHTMREEAIMGELRRERALREELAIAVRDLQAQVCELGKRRTESDRIGQAHVRDEEGRAA